MYVHMQTAETLNPDQISQFLALGDTIEFAGHSRAERYAFAQQLLAAQEYARQGKKQRGAIRAYLSKMTGLSLPQTARLIGMYIETGTVELREYARQGKKQRGAIRAYLSKITGLSLPQTARLIGMYIETGAVELRSEERRV